MHKNRKLKQFLILVIVGIFLGVLFSKILNVITLVSFYEQYKSLFILGFSTTAWLFVIFFNSILYNKNIDVDINIGFKINPVFLGLVFGILFSYNFFKV